LSRIWHRDSYSISVVRCLGTYAFVAQKRYSVVITTVPCLFLALVHSTMLYHRIDWIGRASKREYFLRAINSLHLTLAVYSIPFTGNMDLFSFRAHRLSIS
jgi:hypothetical protein